VRIKGTIKKLPAKESDKYFNSRPRESQLGAWSSEQSAIIEGRNILEAQFEFYKNKFEGKKVPRPPYWGGYLLIPAELEFWQGRENRMHDRIVYLKLSTGKWKMERLSP
jgi:pyridoxamine 5'-phosphate oxidase